MRRIMESRPQYRMRIKESEAILLDIGDTLRKYFRPLSAACIAGVRAYVHTRAHYVARYVARRRPLISRGILPSESRAYRRPWCFHGPLELCVGIGDAGKRGTLDPLFVATTVDFGSRARLPTESRAESRARRLRFSSNAKRGASIIVKRSGEVLKNTTRDIFRDISSEFRARKLSSPSRRAAPSRPVPSQISFPGAEIFAARFSSAFRGSLNEFGIYSNFFVHRRTGLYLRCARRCT